MKPILADGDWAEVDQILSKPLVRTQKALLYSVYKQQFLERAYALRLACEPCADT